MTNRDLNDAVVLAPLLANGYAVVSDMLDKKHFGNRIITLEKGEVRLRIIRETSQWFADVGAAVGDGEWFDISIVMRAVGGPSPVPASTHVSLENIAAFVVATAPRWEPLFGREQYAETREMLRALELASARERFGYVPE